ncbi:MAG: Flp pilus assembly protein CpaB [Coriobacteriaceae bacterium]|nr:Flp pilus assembly protein CpaB [Coriobacteriaceae bacterium]
MKQRTRLIVSVVSGVVAALVALGYAATVREEAGREREEALARFGGELVPVCVATRDIAPGDTIDEANVTVEEWVAHLAPADAETSLSAVAGKVATSRIPKRAVLCPLYFEARSDAVEVPGGAVAVSIASDPEHAVGGALARGDAVDVYAFRNGVADRICAASIVDTSALASSGADLTWVTLAVDPSCVQELLIAMSQAPLSLVVPGRDASAAGSRSASGSRDAQEEQEEAAGGKDDASGPVADSSGGGW